MLRLFRKQEIINLRNFHEVKQQSLLRFNINSFNNPDIFVNRGKGTRSSMTHKKPRVSCKTRQGLFHRLLK